MSHAADEPLMGTVDFWRDRHSFVVREWDKAQESAVAERDRVTRIAEYACQMAELRGDAGAVEACQWILKEIRKGR